MRLIFKMAEDWEDETVDFWLNKEFKFWYCIRDKKFYPRNIPTNLIQTIRRLNK